MHYRKIKGKTVICKDGAYFSLSDEQINELKELLKDIASNANKFYKNDSRNKQGANK